jgi:gliding motility-associated-like protein
MKQFIALIALTLLCADLCAQLSINNTLYNTNQLVNGVLVPVGSGTTISNVSFSGVYNNASKYQVGYFSTATTTLAQMGFSSGVVLTTGNTSDIPYTLGLNPQAAGQMSTGYGSCTAGEVRQTGTCGVLINDLDVLAGNSNYYNAAILEFDFVPVSTVVQFRYIFGSEEYTDNTGFINYQCSSYNDKFGFLISGPGISGGQGFTNNARNIARLPNGSEVSINSVNNGTVGASGGAPSASNCLAANPAWVQNSPSPEYLGTIDGTELNGNTDILTAEQTGLTPGQTYHIKLIITDVSDAAYDAVVYLEAGSFTTLSCVDPAAPTIGTITQPTCSTPTGTVALANLPSSGSWIVTANPGFATITGTGTTANFSSLNPNTTYSFTVTNAAGCSSVASTNAPINALPSNPSPPIVGTITQPSCLSPTGSVALSGLPVTGSWTITSTPGGLTQTGSGNATNFSGLSANTAYTFSVSNASGCVSGASSNVAISVYTPTAPIVGTITQPTCTVATGTVALSGLPSAGSWTLIASPGSLTITGSGTSTVFSNLTAGNSYSFTVTNASGCVSSVSTSAAISTQPSVPTAPIVGTITQPTCLISTGSVALSGLPSSGTWTLTSSIGGTTTGTGTSYTWTGLTAGTTFTVSVTNASTCTSSSSASIAINAIPTQPTPPIVGSITQPSCLTPTGSVSLSGLPATGTWQITTSSGGLTQTGTGTTATFTGLSANTNYTFTVTNTATSCTSAPSGTAAISLYSPTAPIVGAITQPTCTVSTATVALSGLPASGAWTVTCSPGGQTITNTGSTANFPNLPAGASYTFVVADNAGCLSAASTNAVITFQPSTPTVPTIASIVGPTCIVTTGSATISGLPSTGIWTLGLTPGGSFTGTGTTFSLTNLTAGTAYAISVTNSQGCTSIPTNFSIAAIPSNPSAPLIGTITQPTCLLPDGSVVLNGLPSSGNWSINSTPVSTVVTGSGTSVTIAELSANSTYTFNVTDANGCQSMASASVAIGSLPAAPAAPSGNVMDQPTCTVPTGTIELTNPLGPTFSYSIDGVNYQISPIFSGLTPGLYSLTVQNGSTGCISNATPLTINAVPSPPSSPVVNGIDQPSCETPFASVQISAPLGTNYSYSMVNNGVIYPLSSTSISNLLPNELYSLYVLDNLTNCLSAPFDITTNGIPTPESVDAGPDQTINVGQTAVLTATGNGTMIWDNGDTTQTSVSPQTTTTYVVTLTDSNGCVSSDEVNVVLATNCGDLFIPTAFSPNDDAVNSAFRIKINANCIQSMQLRVFDRWGELMFESTNPMDAWDGKYKGKELDPAVFVYVLDIQLDGEQDSIRYTGNLTLIK